MNGRSYHSPFGPCLILVIIRNRQNSHSSSRSFSALFSPFPPYLIIIILLIINKYILLELLALSIKIKKYVCQASSNSHENCGLCEINYSHLKKMVHVPNLQKYLIVIRIKNQ